MKFKHLISLLDLDGEEVTRLVQSAAAFSRAPFDVTRPLEGKLVGIYFEKTSTRTRSAFSVAALKLGAEIVTYGPHDLQLNTGESLEDTVTVFGSYFDCLVARTCRPTRDLELLAPRAKLSLINAMSLEEHPTQAIGDFALLENHFGTLSGLHVLYVGEGNSTAAALLALACRVKGLRLTLATPAGYGVSAEYVARASEHARASGARFEEVHVLDGLPKDVDAVYTARWQTTGSAPKPQDWRERFNPFAVTEELMGRVASPRAVFLHDLPAVRGEEVASSVLDGSRSLAFLQAQYKLFGAMASLKWALS